MSFNIKVKRFLKSIFVIVILMSSFLGNSYAKENAIIAFSEDTYSVICNQNSMTIKVLRTGNISEISTVRYSTVDGTAQDGKDYNKSTGVLTFMPGDTEKTFDISIIPKDYAEEKNIKLSLYFQTNAVLGNNKIAWVHILGRKDNSKPPILYGAIYGQKDNSNILTGKMIIPYCYDDNIVFATLYKDDEIIAGYKLNDDVIYEKGKYKLVVANKFNLSTELNFIISD